VYYKIVMIFTLPEESVCKLIADYYSWL